MTNCFAARRFPLDTLLRSDDQISFFTGGAPTLRTGVLVPLEA
jgi:hypothetical protein